LFLEASLSNKDMQRFESPSDIFAAEKELNKKSDATTDADSF
jgi:hypothetical protein